MSYQKFSESQLRKIHALLTDFLYYAAHCLKIKTKLATTEPLALNQAQRYVHEQIDAQLAATGKVRALVLKGRQQGVSTYVQGRYYWRTSQCKGLRAFILTHEQEATNNLFAMACRYHDLAPDAVKPAIDASNAKELLFSGLDSGYKVGTAGSKGVGRSSTIHLFHGSEVAFWPHAKTHLAGVLQAVPDAPGTEVILESTANGVGGVFYDLWQQAERGEGEYQSIFVPWFWQAEYTKPLLAGFEPSEKELQLVRAYGLSNGQLMWRRTKIAELNGETLFKQEYPCTAKEAFIFSGRTVFDQTALQVAKLECYKQKYRADIDSGGKIVKRDDGRLSVWVDPVAGRKYVIGGDVAEGLEHGDYSCSDVLDAVTGRQVAQWHGHIDPDRFGDVNVNLGKRYNNALLGIERNNHGLTTITRIKDLGYKNIYAQEALDNMYEEGDTGKAGWLTTSKSKPKIIDALAAELRDEDHGICCKETIQEMGSYIIHDDGSLGAQLGSYDDRVMARAIAGEMLRSAGIAKILATKTAPTTKQRTADKVGGY